MAAQNFLLNIARRGFGNPGTNGIQLENSDVNDIVLDGTDGSSSNAGENLITEDVLNNAQIVDEGIEERGTIRLDGIEPLPANSFIVQEQLPNDNIILETGYNFLTENSIVTFESFQVTNVGEKLLQDNALNADTTPLSEYAPIRFFDILRPSKILTEQPLELMVNGKLTPKIITERDSVTPLQLEDDETFITLEDASHNEADDPFRSLRSGQGEIDSGFDHEAGLSVEGGGFIILNATADGAIDANSNLLSEDSFRFAQEENGSLVQEDYDVSSTLGVMLLEDSITEKRIRQERSLEPEEIDAVLLESAGPGDKFYLTDESDNRFIHEIDFKDIDLIISNILLEESTVIGNRGQIPVENYSIGVDQDRPLQIIAKGQQPIVQGSYISTNQS